MFNADIIVSWYELTLTLPILILLLLICYCSGFFFSSVVHKNLKINTLFSDSLSTIFWHLFTGFIILTSIYAIIVTNCKTSLLPVPLLLYLFHKLKNLVIIYEIKSTIIYNNRYRNFLFCLLTIGCYYLYYTSVFISLDDTIVKYIGSDIGFYSRAATYLNDSGQEAIDLDYLNLSDVSNNPYHYGDLWFIALIQRIVPINPIVITATIVYPAFATMFVIGLTGYIKHVFTISNNKPYIYGVIMCTGIIGGFNFLFPQFILQADVLSSSISNAPKLFLVAVLLMALIFSLRTLGWSQTLVLTGIVAFFYINIAIPLLITVSLLLGTAWLFRKEVKFKDFLPGIAIIIVAFIYILVFYYLHGQSSASNSISNSVPFNLSTALNIFIGGLFQYSPYIPFLILLLIYCIKGKRFTFNKRTVFSYDYLFIIFLPIAGLLAWAVFYQITNEAVQFFHNVFIPLSALTIILIVILILQSREAILRTLAVFLLLISTALNAKYTFNVDRIPKNDWVAANNFIKRYKKSYFVNIRHHTEFNSIFTKSTIVGQPLMFLDYIVEPYVNISLNTPWINIDSASIYAGIEQKLLMSAPFSKYVNEKNKELSADDYMYQFIKEKNISFVSVSAAAALPEIFKPSVSDSVIFESGWRLYYVQPL